MANLTWHEIQGLLAPTDVRVTVLQGSEAARRWADVIRSTLTDTDESDPKAEAAADAYDALARMIDSGEAQKHVLAEYRVALAEARMMRETRSKMARDWAGRPFFENLVGDIGRGVTAHIVWLKAQIASLERALAARGVEAA